MAVFGTFLVVVAMGGFFLNDALQHHRAPSGNGAWRQPGGGPQQSFHLFSSSLPGHPCPLERHYQPVAGHSVPAVISPVVTSSNGAAFWLEGSITGTGTAGEKRLQVLLLSSEMYHGSVSASEPTAQGWSLKGDYGEQLDQSLGNGADPRIRWLGGVAVHPQGSAVIASVSGWVNLTHMTGVRSPQGDLGFVSYMGIYSHVRAKCLFRHSFLTASMREENVSLSESLSCSTDVPMLRMRNFADGMATFRPIRVLLGAGETRAHGIADDPAGLTSSRIFVLGQEGNKAVLQAIDLLLTASPDPSTRSRLFAVRPAWEMALSDGGDEPWHWSERAIASMSLADDDSTMVVLIPRPDRGEWGATLVGLNATSGVRLWMRDTGLLAPVRLVGVFSNLATTPSGYSLFASITGNRTASLIYLNAHSGSIAWQEPVAVWDVASVADGRRQVSLAYTPSAVVFCELARSGPRDPSTGSLGAGAVDLATGRTLWHDGGKDFRTNQRTTVCASDILATDSDAYFAAIDTLGENATVLRAVNVRTGKYMWEMTTDAVPMGDGDRGSHVQLASAPGASLVLKFREGGAAASNVSTTASLFSMSCTWSDPVVIQFGWIIPSIAIVFSCICCRMLCGCIWASVWPAPKTTQTSELTPILAPPLGSITTTSTSPASPIQRLPRSGEGIFQPTDNPWSGSDGAFAGSHVRVDTLSADMMCRAAGCHCGRRPRYYHMPQCGPVSWGWREHCCRGRGDARGEDAARSCSCGCGRCGSLAAPPASRRLTLDEDTFVRAKAACCWCRWEEEVFIMQGPTSTRTGVRRRSAMGSQSPPLGSASPSPLLSRESNEPARPASVFKRGKLYRLPSGCGCGSIVVGCPFGRRPWLCWHVFTYLHILIALLIVAWTMANVISAHSVLDRHLRDPREFYRRYIVDKSVKSFPQCASPVAAACYCRPDGDYNFLVMTGKASFGESLVGQPRCAIPRQCSSLQECSHPCSSMLEATGNCAASVFDYICECSSESCSGARLLVNDSFPLRPNRLELGLQDCRSSYQWIVSVYVAFTAIAMFSYALYPVVHAWNMTPPEGSRRTRTTRRSSRILKRLCSCGRRDVVADSDDDDDDDDSEDDGDDDGDLGGLQPSRVGTRLGGRRHTIARFPARTSWGFQPDGRSLSFANMPVGGAGGGGGSAEDVSSPLPSASPSSSDSERTPFCDPVESFPGHRGIAAAAQTASTSQESNSSENSGRASRTHSSSSAPGDRGVPSEAQSLSAGERALQNHGQGQETEGVVLCRLCIVVLCIFVFCGTGSLVTGALLRSDLQCSGAQGPTLATGDVDWSHASTSDSLILRKIPGCQLNTAWRDENPEQDMYDQTWIAIVASSSLAGVFAIDQLMKYFVFREYSTSAQMADKFQQRVQHQGDAADEEVARGEVRIPRVVVCCPRVHRRGFIARCPSALSACCPCFSCLCVVCGPPTSWRSPPERRRRSSSSRGSVS